MFGQSASLQERHGYAKSEAMPTDPNEPKKRPLPPAAERDRAKTERPKESGGRGGLEPTRYGDWERDGLTSDF